MKVGDTVCLKSNPYQNMSVEVIDEQGFIHCCWHNKEGSLVREPFYKDTLEISDPHASRLADTFSEALLHFVYSYFD